MSNLEAVNTFILSKSGNTRKILDYLHNLLHRELELECKIRFKIPFYYYHSWVFYLNPIDKDGVELAFLRANEMGNWSGLLDFKGRKQVAGIEIHELKDVDWPLVYEVIQEALVLDESIPYKSKRK